MPWRWTGTRESLHPTFQSMLGPLTICSSDSAVVFLPTGSSLLHKGAMLLRKLFLVPRRDLPSYNPYPKAWPSPSQSLSRTAFLPQGHPSYTWQQVYASPWLFHPQPLPLSLRHHDFQTVLVQAASISPPFHSQYVTQQKNRTPFWTCPPGILRPEFTDHTAWFCNR